MDPSCICGVVIDADNEEERSFWLAMHIEAAERRGDNAHDECPF